MLLQMYKKAQFKQNGNSSDKELIDISSDDDVAKVDSKNEKDVKMPEPGCTVADESSQHVALMVASKLETTTVKPETTTVKQETLAAKPDMTTSKPETSVKSKLVCIFIRFTI